MIVLVEHLQRQHMLHAVLFAKCIVCRSYGKGVESCCYT